MQTFPNTFDIASLNGTNGFIIRSETFSYLGVSVASVGDVNNDGKSDIIVVAWAPNGQAGAACVIYGGSGNISIDDILIGLSSASYGNRTQNGMAYLIYGKNESLLSDIYLATISDKEGVVLIGAQSFDATDNAVALAGDFNDDGINDIIFGAYNASTLNLTSAGAAYIMYGGRNFNESYNSTLSGNLNHDHAQIDVIN